MAKVYSNVYEIKYLKESYLLDNFRTTLKQKKWDRAVKLLFEIGYVKPEIFDGVTVDFEIVEHLKDAPCQNRDMLLYCLMKSCIESKDINGIKHINCEFYSSQKTDFINSAIDSKDQEIIKLVIKRFVDKKYYCVSDHIRKAILAHDLNLIKLIKELIDCEFEHRDLEDAIKEMDVEIIKFIVDHSQIDPLDKDVICRIICADRIDIMKLISKFIKTSDLLVFRLCAIKYGTVDMMKYFLDFSESDKLEMINETVINCLLDGQEPVQKLQVLLEHGADLAPGRSFLEKKASPEILEFLKNQESPEKVFRNAVLNGDLKTIKFCVKAGIDVHLDHDWAFDYALTNKNLDLIKCLLSIE